jgi:hypothetical protein
MTPALASVLAERKGRAMDYEVDYDTLARAGTKAQGLAGDVAGTLRGMRLDDVAPAVPGGISAAAADHVDGKWADSSDELGAALRRFSEALAETAEAYRSVEDQAAAASESFFGGI